MADTRRALAALQALFPDNNTKLISPQDLRDFLISVFADMGYDSGDATTAAQLKDAVDKKHAESHDAASHSDIASSGANIDDAVAKKHSNAADHTQGTDTTLGVMAADVNMNTHKLTGLSVPSANGHSIRATTKIREPYLEDAIEKKDLLFKLPNPALNLTIANRVDHTQGTASKGKELNLINTNYIQNGCWFYSGKYNRTYFLYIESAAESLEGFIFYYDHDTDTFSGNYSFGIPQAGAIDDHSHPAIIVNNKGEIVTIREELSGVGASAHNSPFLVRVTDNPEDLSAYTEYTKLDDYHTYPNLQILTDGTLFLTSRYGLASNDHYRRCLYKSTDGGHNWENLAGSAGSNTVYAHFGSSPARWAYGFRIMNANRQGLFDIVNLRQEAGTYLAYPDAYFLYSLDGDTWGNIKYFETGRREGFSKDVKTSGYLTKSELDTNCLIAGDGSSGTNMRHVVCCCVSFNNHIYLVLDYGTYTAPNTPNVTARYFMYYDLGTSAWISVNMSDVTGLATNERLRGVLVPVDYEDQIFDLFARNSSGNLVQWRTENRGVNWRKIADINTSTDIIGKIKANNNYPDNLILSMEVAQDMGAYSDVVTATFSKAI